MEHQVTLEFLCTCGGQGSSRSGFETLSQGTGKDRAGHCGAWTSTVVLGHPLRMHLKMLQGEDGLSHHGQLEASSAAPKVRHHLPPGGDMTQRQKVTNLLLYPGRDLIGLLRTGDCSCWIVQGATLWLDKYSSGGAKIYLPSSVQAHLLKTLAYISYSPSQLPSYMFFIFHVNILAH